MHGSAAESRRQLSVEYLPLYVRPNGGWGGGRCVTFLAAGLGWRRERWVSGVRLRILGASMVTCNVDAPTLYINDLSR